MNTADQPASSREISHVKAKAELARLCDDPRFRGTDRTRSILRYLAQRRFEGNDDSVKAYSVAIDVLGRTSDFDPATDPIVRIEMSRLRLALSQYYEAFGDETDVSIALPKGHYVTVFTAMAEQPAGADDRENIEAPCLGGDVSVHTSPPAGDTVEQPSVPEHLALAHPASSGAPRQGGRHGWSVAVGIGLIVAVAALWQLFLPATITLKPTVLVTVTADDERMAGEASQTRDMLLTALTQFQTLIVASGSAPDNVFHTAMRSFPQNAYTIDLKYYYAGEKTPQVRWQVISARGGKLLASGSETLQRDDNSPLLARYDLVKTLSRRFATSRGIINTIEANESPQDALGNACVLRAERELDAGRIHDLAASSSCLIRTIAVDPANTDAIAALSRVTTAQAGGRPDKAVTERSVELARQAVTLTPLSDRAQIALMMVQFYGGRTEAAVNAGRRALELNPNNPEAAAKLAMVLFTSGGWDAAVALAQDATHGIDVVPRDASLVLAMDAYRRGDWTSASALSEKINDGGFTTGMLRAASLGEMGSPQAADSLADLRSIIPDFESRYLEIMAARRYDPMLSASFAQGLEKAGARIVPRNIASAF